MRRTAVCLATALAAAGLTAATGPGVAATASSTSTAGGLVATAVAEGTLLKAGTSTRDVMFVGNNWAGTATVVDARTYRVLSTIDTIPEKDARMAEIIANP